MDKIRELKISIVTVVYNGDKYLEETILSVLNQTYKNIQYIIIDGGSTDNSINIIKKYEKNIDYWISEKDNGMYDALRKGFTKVSGDICAYINSDDFYPPTAFETAVEIFSQHPEIKWIRGMGIMYNENSTIVGAGRPFINSKNSIRKYLFGPIAQESMFWRKELHQLINWEKFASFRLAGDHYMWYCFAEKADLYTINAWIGGHRRHNGQLSSDMNKYLKEINTFVDKKKPVDYLIKLYWKILYKLCNDKQWKKISKGKILSWNIKTSRYE